MEKQLNSDKFLAAFSELEKYFKREFFKGEWKSFKQMLKEGSRFNPIIKQYKEDLFEFADLRNAIVHNRSTNYRVIAEPHDFVVEQFESIKNQIINPKLVSSFFKKVHTCSLTDSISVPLQLIHNQKISQIPVLDSSHSVVELLNATTIAYWLADVKNFAIDVAKVETVLQHREYSNNYQVVAAGISAIHAAEIFRESYSKPPTNRYYDALLITQNGGVNEPLKGIIVLSDIAEYL